MSPIKEAKDKKEETKEEKSAILDREKSPEPKNAEDKAKSDSKDKKKSKNKSSVSSRQHSARQPLLDEIAEEVEEEEKSVTNDSSIEKARPSTPDVSNLLSQLEQLLQNIPFLKHKYRGNLLNTYFEHTNEEYESAR